MTYELRYLPEVEEDTISACAWYEEQSTGLGDEFLRVFYGRSHQLIRQPFSGRKVFNTLRRCLLPRFPYALYYKVAKGQIIVFGLFHCARDPRRIKGELGERGNLF